MAWKNQEQRRAYQRDWCKKNRARLAAKKKEYYEQNKEWFQEYERNRQLVNTYGITAEQYDRMLLEQGNCCKLCKKFTNGPKGLRFSVDHCHKSGKIRGILCMECNTRLGWYEKNIESVKEYLSA